TPLKLFWPCQIAPYPIFSNTSAGKPSSIVLISCKQATSGFVSSSHSSKRGRRALIPLMLKLAILTEGAIRQRSLSRNHSRRLHWDWSPEKRYRQGIPQNPRRSREQGPG